MKQIDDILSETTKIKKILRNSPMNKLELARGYTLLAFKYKKSGGIGFMHKHGHFYLAMKYFEKAENIFLNEDPKKGMSVHWNNFGVFLRSYGSFKKSEALFKKCISFLQNEGEDSFFEQRNLACLYIQYNYNLDQAKQILDNCILKYTDPEEIAFNTLWHARYLLQKEEIDFAHFNLLAALDQLQEKQNKINSTTRWEILHTFSKVLKQRGQINEAANVAYQLVKESEKWVGQSFWTAQQYKNLAEIYLEKSDPRATYLFKHADYLIKRCKA